MTAGLLSLFIGSLLASSILPGGVEVLLYAMVRSGGYSSLTLLWVAGVGNTLGGITTYAIGALAFRAVSRGLRLPLRLSGRWRRRFTPSGDALARVRRWGAVSLLFSWLPIIGDPLCLAAGYLRLAFWQCVLMIAIGKFARYWVLLWLIS